VTGAPAHPAIYLCPTEHCPHLLQFAVGLVPEMQRRYGSVGVFRPIVANPATDPVLPTLLRQVANVADLPHWGVTADDVLHNPTTAMADVIARYAECALRYDAMLVLGSEYDCSLAPIEFSWNTRVSANIDVPMAFVVPSAGDAERVIARVDVAIDEATRNHAQVLAVLVPRSEGQPLDAAELEQLPVPAFVIDEITGADSGLEGALASVAADVVAGARGLAGAPVGDVVVADMGLRHLLPLIGAGSVVLFAGDRSEIPLGMLVGCASKQFPAPAAAIAAGPWPLALHVTTLWDRLAPSVPLLRTTQPIEEVYLNLDQYKRLPALVNPDQLLEAGRVFARAVDSTALFDRPRPIGQADVVTPLMFEHQLLERARTAGRHIVLPEGEEERILRAAARLLALGTCRLTLLGDPATIRAHAQRLGLDIGGAALIDASTSDLRPRFAERYADLRAHKGVTLDQASERVTDPSYFGTMMVLEGQADGMVSGAVNTTAHTIRPALEVIKTKPGVSVVSSVFLMCLPNEVLVFGDCAVNPNPTPDQVADIAISSAATARQFGIEPRVALLSYSTGTSGSGPDVEATAEATRLVRERAPELPVDGPLQYDAAVDPGVAGVKRPDSPVAGRATVLIFPDLRTGNNTYKAVQRSSGALAIGPVLQGLNKPVNDLSRGAHVSDIVNTVAITAIQAGADR